MSANILLVEYEPRYVERVQEALSGPGYAVEVAGDIDAAVEVCAAFEPHAVIMTSVLPQIKIEDAITQLRGRAGLRATPILILMSGYSGDDPVGEAAKYSAQGILGRPFSGSDLLERINALLKEAADPAATQAIPQDMLEALRRSAGMEEGSLTSDELFGDILSDVEGSNVTKAQPKTPKSPQPQSTSSAKVDDVLAGLVDSKSTPHHSKRPTPPSDTDVDAILSKTLAGLDVQPVRGAKKTAPPSAPKAPTEMPDDPDAAMKWLESLAAKQGAKEEELVLSTAEERAAAEKPEWVAEQGDAAAETPQAEAAAPSEDLPDWMTASGGEEAPASAAPAAAPEAPTEISRVLLPSTVQGLFVNGSYAYVADGFSGAVIVDISDQNNPSIVGSFETENYCFNIFAEGDLMFLANGDNGLQIVDISNPANPFEISSLDYTANNVFVVDNYMYLAHDYRGILIYDISTPANPLLTGMFTENTLGYDVWVEGNYAYLGDSNGLIIIDISDKTNPVEKSSVQIRRSTQDIFFNGGIVYLASQANGLNVIDATNPESPALLSNFDTDGYSEGVWQSGDNAFVADGYSGLKIITAAESGAPVLSGSFSTAGRIIRTVIKAITYHLFTFRYL